MTIYSQLDSRWGNIKIGSSEALIKDYGCTITCIGILLDLPPDVVNRNLIGVGGYSQGNLVIWDKIKAAFPDKVESVRREWSYNNEDVKNNVPCIVQVNGAPIGGTMHFVVYKGNQQLVDPWGGVVRPTYTYVPQSYCVIKRKAVTSPNADEYIATALSAASTANNAIVTAKQVGDPQYSTKIVPVSTKLQEAVSHL